MRIDQRMFLIYPGFRNNTTYNNIIKKRYVIVEYDLLNL